MINNLDFPNAKNSIVQQLKINDQFNQLFIKRDDLIHSIISGNKWRKLKYNIKQIQQNGHEGILTFGGAYSNHLLAVAYTCRLYEIKSVGIVRGEELNAKSNLVLAYCESLGMKLKFIKREEYSLKEESEFKQDILSEFSNYWIVPEGGANYQGVIGAMEIMKETCNDFDFACISQGTTATSLGILLSIPEQTRLLVCPALKSFDSKLEMVNRLRRMGFEQDFITEKMDQVIVLNSDEFGKYGNTPEKLKSFASQCFEKTGISFDLTYNARSIFRMMEYLESNKKFTSKILYIHTGGFS